MTKTETPASNGIVGEQHHDILIGNTTVDYHFPFIDDARFIFSPQKDLILKLAGSENTIPAIQKAMAELGIRNRLSVTRLIPSDDQQWRIIPATGTASRTTSPTSVELLFDPNNQNTVDSLASWGDRQIAHELSHVARMEVTQLHTTLLDALVSEGIGVYYEEFWQGEYAESHWGHILDEQGIVREWDIARPELASLTFDYSDWFYGRQNGHPIYTGYSLGNTIVKAFMDAHPSISIAELSRLPSADIVKEGKFST